MTETATETIDGEKVFILTTHDISTVQGTTEANYVANFFAERGPTYVFAPVSRKMPGVETHKTGSGGLATLLLINLVYLPHILYAAWKHRPSAVYSYRNVILPPLLIGAFTNATVVYDLQVDPYKQPKEFNDSLLQGTIFPIVVRHLHAVALARADVIFTLSEPLKQSLVENFDVTPEKIQLIPLGVDTDVFVPLSTDRATFHVCYVGSMREHRGLELVIRALNSIDEEVQRDIVFELFGSIDEAYRSELESIADGSYQLKWHGHVPHEEIPERVGRCDCAVSPLPPLEGFEVSSPAKVFEYLALGLPVIATDITPHQRILCDENSRLTEPGDPAAMGSAIEELAQDEERCRTLSEAARHTALEHSWEARFETIVAAIDRADHSAR